MCVRAGNRRLSAMGGSCPAPREAHRTPSLTSCNKNEIKGCSRCWHLFSKFLPRPWASVLSDLRTWLALDRLARSQQHLGKGKTTPPSPRPTHAAAASTLPPPGPQALVPGRAGQLCGGWLQGRVQSGPEALSPDTCCQQHFHHPHSLPTPGPRVLPHLRAGLHGYRPSLRASCSGPSAASPPVSLCPLFSFLFSLSTC